MLESLFVSIKAVFSLESLFLSGLNFLNKSEHWNLRMIGCEDVRMQGYQQAHSAHNPKDKKMWGYEVTSKHIRTSGYEDARMQVRVLEYEEMRMWGCEDTSKYRRT